MQNDFVAASPEFQKVNLNQAKTVTDEQLKNVMDYHPWTPEKVEKGNKVRAALSEALRVIIETVPPSADRSAAIRKIRDCRMDCNSAITHDGSY